jgi:5,10-methylene-tetrahydrofolate dehydrogenase/methenyl tetrahydrofolate cyclohydrolase
MPTTLDGRIARAELKKKLSNRVADFKKKHGFRPILAIVQIGDRPDIASYIKAKKSFGLEIGAEVRHVHLKEDISREEIIKEIRKLNDNETISGIILQLPLPEALKADKSNIIDTIDPVKDADGLTSSSVKRWSSIVQDSSSGNIILPATARGVLELLNFYKISLKGKKVCVIGRSELVGTPIAAMCRGQGAVVTVCHSKTIDLVKETSASDVIISAVGRPGLIGAKHVRPGQIIVDVGINEVKGNGLNDSLAGKNIDKLEEEIPKRKLVGDVDFDAVLPILGDSGAITPVPGGVGPMTVLALFENLADLCDIM